MSAARPTLSAVSCGFSSSLVAETETGGIVNLHEPTQSQGLKWRQNLTKTDAGSIKNKQVYSGQFTFLIWVNLPLIMINPLPSLKGKILKFIFLINSPHKKMSF